MERRAMMMGVDGRRKVDESGGGCKCRRSGGSGSSSSRW